MKVTLLIQIVGVVLCLLGFVQIEYGNTRLGLYALYVGVAFSALSAAFMAYCFAGERMRAADRLDSMSRPTVCK